jgi:hypothetical protein
MMIWKRMWNEAVVAYFKVVYYPSICLQVKQPQNTPMEEQREKMYSSYSFTTSAVDGCEW